MNIVLDLIPVAVIAISVIAGWRKGFVTMVMRLASSIIAGVGAFFLYPYIAEPACNKIFLPGLTSVIEDAIHSGANNRSIAELFEKKPDFFVDILNRYSTEEKVESFFESGGITVEAISKFMAEPLAETVANVLSFALCFLVLLLLLHLLTRLLDRICELPVLKKANSLLGSVLGLAFGVVLAWIFAVVIAGVWPGLSLSYPDIFQEGLPQSTVLLKQLYQFNPLSLFY